MIAMTELSTEMSLLTYLPTYSPPTITYSKFSLAQLVMLKAAGTSLDRGNIDTRILSGRYPQTPAINN